MPGRGAWPKTGEGGTLNGAGTGPGQFYRAPADGNLDNAPGAAGWTSPDVNERAVHGAVRAIQRHANRQTRPDVPVDGVYGPLTGEAVARVQERFRIIVDGITGPQTAKVLLRRQLLRLVPQGYAYIVCGLVQNESAWDPGAVGYSDPTDLGLAQINGAANPTYTDRERLTPSVAFTYAYHRFMVAEAEFDGNLGDAVASYNLGTAGCYRWIAAGRPDSWTPSGSAEPRHMGGVNCEHGTDQGYIGRILTSCEDLKP